MCATAVRVAVFQAPTNRKPPASKTAEQAHAAAPSQPAALVAASDDAAAPGAPSLPGSLHCLPGPVPRDAASAALLDEWPGDAEHKTYTLHSVLKGFEPDLSMAPTQRARASPAAVAATRQVAQNADQGGARALRAMYVHATVQCHECNKLRAVYCKQPLRKLEKLHAGRRAVVPDDTGSDSDGNACNAGAADSNGSDGMGRGSAVAEENLSQRGAVVDGDADGATATGSSGNATEPTQLQAKSAGAYSTHATGQFRSVQQPRQLPLVWWRTQQTLTRHSQHPSLMSRRTMQTWMHMQILARMQLLRRMQVQTRKQTQMHLRTQMQVLVRTLVLPCHQAALASASVAVHA
jgi:hypothetical protein